MWRQILSASGLLLCVETDGVSIWLIGVCRDRCCQHLVYFCVWRQMLSAFGSLLCVETDADQHLVDCRVWRQMLSAFGLLMCAETDAVSIWFIDVCGDRCCQH